VSSFGPRPSSLWLAWLALSVACGKRAEPGGASAASTATGSGSASTAALSAANPISPATAPSSTLVVERVKPACRALAVSGVATVDGAPLATSSLLDGEHWVELSAGASIALRHTQTSREFKLIGPGHALPCRNGSEQILLADGQLSTSANLGVRPGAEVLIATPHGAVHFGDAALDLALARNGLHVRVKQGEAWVEPEERGVPHFKNPVHSGVEVKLASAPGDAQARVDACETTAQAAGASARRVLESVAAGGADSLGARAATHMRERAKARMSCAIAAAATFNVRDPALRQRLSASVAHADALWQSVPRANP